MFGPNDAVDFVHKLLKVSGTLFIYIHCLYLFSHNDVVTFLVYLGSIVHVCLFSVSGSKSSFGVFEYFETSIFFITCICQLL